MPLLIYPRLAEQHIADTMHSITAYVGLSTGQLPPYRQVANCEVATTELRGLVNNTQLVQ